jgi:NhaP-type Na+/H+ or K+/H+ antiporter
VTIFASYLIFYIGENVLKVSGILSLVVMGLYISHRGKTGISSYTELVKHVWTYLAFAAETLVFLLSGIIIGFKILQNPNITANDYLVMIALFFLINIIRFASLVLFWPIMRLLGYGLDFKFYCPM